jgi:hypothetical protein
MDDEGEIWRRRRRVKGRSAVRRKAEAETEVWTEIR